MDIDKWRRSAERQRMLNAQAAPKEATHPKADEIARLRREVEAEQQREIDAQLGEEIGETLRRNMLGKFD